MMNVKRPVSLMLAAALAAGVMTIGGCRREETPGEAQWMVAEYDITTPAPVVPDVMFKSAVILPSWTLLAASDKALVFSHTSRMRGGFENSDLMVYDPAKDSVTARMTMPNQEKPLSAVFITDDIFRLTSLVRDGGEKKVDTVFRTDLYQMARDEEITVTDDGYICGGLRFEITPDGVTAYEVPEERLFLTQRKAGEKSYRLVETRSGVVTVMDENDVPVISHHTHRDEDHFLLADGSLLVRYTLPVYGRDGGAPEAGSYDYVGTEAYYDVETDTTAHREVFRKLHTILISSRDGSETELDMPGAVAYVIDPAQRNENARAAGQSPIYTDAVRNIVAVCPITGGRLSDEPRYYDLSDDGVLTPMPEWVPGQSEPPIRVAADRFLVRTGSMETYLCTGGGEILARPDVPEEYYYQPELLFGQDLFVSGGCLWDYDGHMLFDFEARGLTFSSLVNGTDTVIFSRINDKWMTLSVFVWNDGVLTPLVGEKDPTALENGTFYGYGVDLVSDGISVLFVYDGKTKTTSVFNRCGDQLGSFEGALYDGSEKEQHAGGVLLISVGEDVYVVRNGKGDK